MKPESAVRIVQISDCHLRSTPGAQNWGVDVDAGLRAVLALATGLRPALLLATGDLVHDEGTPAYERLRDDFLLPSGLPVAALPGNHDDSDALAACWSSGPVQRRRQLETGGWQLLLLDTRVPQSPAGRLAPSELDFLQQSLAARPQTPTLVALHHPPLLTGCAGFDAIALENRAGLFAVLRAAPQVRALVFGHLHAEIDTVIDGIRCLGCPSTCIQFDLQAPEPAADAAHGPGCRLLELFPDGRLQTQVLRVEAA